MEKEETVIIEICGDELEINKKVFEDFEELVRSKHGELNDELFGKELSLALSRYMEFKKTGKYPVK